MGVGRIRRNLRLAAFASSALLGVHTAASAQAASSSGPGAPAPPSSVQATAATSPQPDGTTVGEIVVTAQKRQQSLSDVPLSITAVGRQDLLNKGITDVQSLVKVTPGLSFVESGNSVPVFSLRGVGFFDASIGSRPTVSVYSDEIPLPFSITATGAALDLERVEVLKGPQGTLFGQNSTGGAINYIAAKPLDHPEAGFTASYSRFNTIDLTGYATGPVAKDVDARLSFRTLRSDDYQKSYTRDDSLGAKKIYQGRLLLDWKPTDKLKFEFNVNGFVDKSDTQAAQLIAVLPQIARAVGTIPLITSYPLSPRSDRAADFDAGRPLRRDNGFYQLALRADYELAENLSLTSITAYSRESIHQVSDQDGTAINAVSSNVVGYVSSVSEEVRLSGTLGRAQFVVGGNYSYDKSDENNAFNFPYATANAALPTGRFDSANLTSTQKFDTKAIFGNVEFKLLDTLSVQGGVRYTQADLDYAACSKPGDQTTANTLTAFDNLLRSSLKLPPITPLTPAACLSVDANFNPGQLVGNLDQDNVSWRAGLNWKPAPQTLIYANVSRGYKAGSVPTLPALGLAALRPVTQESVLAYEAGFKVPVIRRKLEATGAFFYYDYSDKQLLGRVLTQPTALGALQALVNVPKSRIKGAEFQINAFPIQGWTVAVGGTYLDSEVTRDFINYSITEVQTNFKGDSFPYTPKFQLVVDTQYEFPVPGALTGFVGGDINYRSKTTAGFGDIGVLAIDSYALGDLRAGVRDPVRRWQVQAFIRNVADTYYWTNVARINDTVRRYAGEPRTYGIQVSATF